MMGRKPVPTALKLLRGTLRKDRLNIDEPHPDPLESSCPEELVDPVARAEWRRAIVPAIAIGQVTAADRALAIAHCELWAARQSQLRDASRHSNVIIAGETRRPIEHPAAAMAATTLKALLRVDGELGLLPSTRERVRRRA